MQSGTEMKHYAPVDTNDPQGAQSGYPQPTYSHPTPPPAYYPPTPKNQPPIVQPPVAQPPNVIQANIVPGTVIIAPAMGNEPFRTVCPSCRQQMVTNVKYAPTMKTHLFAVLLCLLFWPCTCLPYCIDSCQSAEHYCNNCNAYIGTSL